MARNIALVGIGKIAVDRHIPAIAGAMIGNWPPQSAGRAR